MQKEGLEIDTPVIEIESHCEQQTGDQQPHCPKQSLSLQIFPTRICLSFHFTGVLSLVSLLDCSADLRKQDLTMGVPDDVGSPLFYSHPINYPV